MSIVDFFSVLASLSPLIFILLMFIVFLYKYIKPRRNKKNALRFLSVLSVLGMIWLINTTFFRMQVPEFESVLEKHSDFFIILNQDEIKMEDNDRFGGNMGARRTWLYKFLNKDLLVVSKKYDGINAKFVDGHWKVTAPTSIKDHSKEEITAGFEGIIDKFITANKGKYTNRIEWKREGNASLIRTVEKNKQKLIDFDISSIKLGSKPTLTSGREGITNAKVKTNQGNFYLQGGYYIEGLHIELLQNNTWQVEVSDSYSFKSLDAIDSSLDKFLKRLIVELENKRRVDIKKNQPKGW